nr:double-CXXCG motif protein [Corallococcus soli]
MFPTTGFDDPQEEYVKFFQLLPEEGPRFTGFLNGVHQWGLPGGLCPVCEASPGGLGEAYPSVDLSGWSHRHELAEARQVPLEEYERLRDLLRPHTPPGALLLPDSEFGLLRAKASGRWGALHLPYAWLLVIQREALKRLREEAGIELSTSKMDLLFRGSSPPELLEVEVHPCGRLHDSCFLDGRERPCERCGRQGDILPDIPILDGSTLPVGQDLFRLVDFTTLIIATERFVEAVNRLGLEGVVFKEVPVT